MENGMPKDANATFEESLERIRAIVDDLEGGELSLDDSIEKFREGSALLGHARKLISEAELRVRVLTEHEGAPELEHD
jgi:exodeoxyribonuclease VII small subunit